MIKLHRRILTQQPKVPFIWVLLANLTWFNSLYGIFVSGTAFPITLRRFTQDTVTISLLTGAGLWVGWIIGPLVNYVSDHLWSRFGRRRPFMIVAAMGTLLFMILIPYMPSLAPMILLVVISSTLGDIGATQEPLWLECVPPSQRGQSYAIRQWLINLASFYFFQVMFSQLNFVYNWTIPGLGHVSYNGEQVAYGVAAFLQIMTLVYLCFLVKEVRPQNVELKSWRELDFSPIPFIVKFVQNVFGDRRWWWIYLFYIAPSFAASAWGSGFSNIMLLDQFKYGNPEIALTGFPMMILSFIVTPCMGWYSDHMPKWSYSLQFGISALAAAGLYFFTRKFAVAVPLDLPPVWVLFVICVLAFAAVIPFTLAVFQIIQLFTPGKNKRLWAWYLGIVINLIMAVAGYVIIRVLHAGSVPSLTTWFVLGCVVAATGYLGIVSGPLLYDYMPKDKIGTISAGFGVNGLVSAALMAVCGFWIKYYTRWEYGPNAPNDYSSCYILQIIFTLISLGLMTIFLVRGLRGKMIEYGRLNLNSDGSPCKVEDGEA